MSATAQAVPLRPPLKWAGGKRWLAPLLRLLYEPCRERRLVEPFCGGLSVALALAPGRALLNDVNPHAINFYRQLQAGLKVTLPMRNEREVYERYRADFNARIAAGRAGTKLAAQLFYYLNRTGYNGLCRFNSRGEFNVPFGRYDSIRYRRDFLEYLPVLAGWEFREGDFASLPVEPDDFVYADPPYDVEFRQYSAGGFDWAEQERLVRWLVAHPGPVVLSNQATPKIEALYAEHGFECWPLSAPRMIACNGDRTRAREVLALRNVSPGAAARRALESGAA